MDKELIYAEYLRQHLKYGVTPEQFAKEHHFDINWLKLRIKAGVMK